MADSSIGLSQARELHAQSLWAEAYEQFAEADRDAQLDADDLEHYAEAAQILGRGADAIRLLRRAFNLRVDAREVDQAITSAFWICQALIINAEFARASGWAAQVRHSMPDVDNGWLLFLEAYFLIAAADYDQAARLLARAADMASRRREPDLVAFATTVWGRALIKGGRLKEGLSRLDEAMVPVVERDTSPRATSMMYCSAIATCYEAREFSRASEWTHALGAWLDSLPRLGGAYFGNCRIYRAHLMCLRGSWGDALDEVAFVCDDLSGNYGQLVAGHAHYQLARYNACSATLRPRPAIAGQQSWARRPSQACLCCGSPKAIWTRRCSGSGVHSPRHRDSLSASTCLRPPSRSCLPRATTMRRGRPLPNWPSSPRSTQLRACRPSLVRPAARLLSATEILLQPCPCCGARRGTGGSSTPLTLWQR
jgi:tetratricopeptide (TPR) repeat protein